ncbi:9036_t:CDS:10 [Entrophospora sp. SA101]|nr:9036_t:CDS:10 [Entrophospora sp. SA101]
MLYNHQRGGENSSILLLLILFIIFLLLSCKVESRLTDGSDNNLNNPTSGTPNQTFQMKYPPKPFFGPDGDSMIKTPSDIVDTDPKQPIPKCTDPLPADTYPMPRCISNIITNYQLDQFDVAKATSYRSKRQTSHLATFFALFVNFDIISSSNSVQSSHQLYIPSDDATYNSITSLPGQLSNSKSLAFNRSDFLPTQTPKRTGYNKATPFLDLSPIYGVTAENAKNLREGNRGKLKTSGNAYDPYPFKDPTTGNYVTGPVGKRAINVFTMAILTIWLREHNRLCDEFYEKNGDAWTDDQYFEEARKWNIAFYQRVVTEEYLGVILGKPLPPYQKYDPDLTPGIDVFFSTITFRYGHSELSDFYQIQDEFGNSIVQLSLQNIMIPNLLEKFGVANLLGSMSLQRQEDVDIYYSDATRNVQSPEPNTYDLVAFDALRARDRDTWADITSVKEIQDNLQKLYPNGTNQLEALVGAMAEDHLNGTNLGELLNASMITQFANIRDSDRFWWENRENNLFTDEDRTTKLRNKTTFRDIILRNLDEIFHPAIPQNIWSVQPKQKLFESSKYLNRIALWPAAYVIGYEIIRNHINFQVQILTTDGNAWFGMGFDPDNNGMTGADFVIGIISNGNLSSLSNYRSAPTGYYPPTPDGDDSDLQIINYTPPIKDNFAIIEFSRPLIPNGRKGIRSGSVKLFSYHQNNRQLTLYDFYSNQFSSSVSNGQRLAKLAHGIGMFLTWCYIKIHRFAQLLGGISIGSFGAAAMATISMKTSHSWLGLTIYFLLFIELGLGLISMWGQVAIVSVNQGYPRFLKRIHRLFGISLLLCAWVNIYLGIDTYSLSYGFESFRYKVAYLIWISVMEMKKEIKKNSIISSYITEEDLAKMPEFTWSEINERVQRGAYLIVCDGFIVNMRKWIKVHPGGAKILERVIGTDITNDFFGYKGKGIIEQISNIPEIKSVPTGISSSVLGKYKDILHERTKKYTTEKNSVAQVVDDMNVKYFLKAPLAIHPHSLFAIKKIATMIVAKLKETPDVVLGSQMSPAPIFGPTNVADGRLSDSEIAKQDTAFRVKFRRYKLTSKVPINGSKTYPVMKFTFTIVHENEAYNHKLKFLPGHYIEVQSRIKGQVVIRSYTPIEGSIAQSFSIFVKVYPDGLMSRHLNEQLKGYEIQVRGPFDVGDREVLQTPTLSQTVDAASQYRKSSIYSLSTPSFISSSTSSLLNPNTQDGHWKELYMICGGTGIAPMLQLMIYHLELCMRRSRASTTRNKRVSMHLLYGNYRVEDIINGVELEEYRLSSRGMLSITYSLNKPPPEWTGKIGEINQEMISDWLGELVVNDSKNKITADDTDIPDSLSPQPFIKHSSYGGGSLNNMSNMIQFNSYNNTTNTSYLPINTSQSQLNNSDDDINTNTTNLPTSTNPPQFYNPLSYDNNNDNRPPIIPHHTKPPPPSIVFSNNQNTYRTSINPESALTHSNVTAGNNKRKSKLNPNSKIFVCGQSGMINVVEQTLQYLGYTEEDFILIA